LVARCFNIDAEVIAISFELSLSPDSLRRRRKTISQRKLGISAANCGAQRDQAGLRFESAAFKRKTEENGNKKERRRAET
jgi:hypothetical protein